MRHRAIASRDRAALIVIDVQEKLFPPIYRKNFMLTNLTKLISFCQIVGIPIVVTEQYPEGLGQTIDLIREVLDNYRPIAKTSFSCFGADEFRKRIEQLAVSTLLISGMETHVCVSQTALDGQNENFRVFVASDAVSSRTEENWKAGLEKMKANGVFVSSTEMIMFEILEKSNTSEFKKVVPLLK